LYWKKVIFALVIERGIVSFSRIFVGDIADSVGEIACGVVSF